MKLLFPFILLLNFQPLKGEQKMKTYQSFVLRYTFASVFSDSEKYCCKLSNRCDKLLDSTGFTTKSLEGRVEIKKGDGWIEFRIINVQPGDAGPYRCVVMGSQQDTYKDFQIELFEVTPTFRPSTASAALPQSTAADGDLRDDRRAPWSFGLPLTIVVSMAAMLLVTSIIGVIFCRFKARKLDKCGEKSHESPPQESLPQEAAETGGIVYTTVDFKARQGQPKVHRDPRVHETQTEEPKDNSSREHDGTVEYSVLPCHY